jgi:bifunctional non-homologous end joining protein LigD
VPAASFPTRIVPMQPELASEPFHRPGWVYEEKLDGWRMVAYKDGPRVRLVSRTGVDHTARFPGIAAAVAGLLAPQLVLDGEVCVFDDQLVSQFHLLGWGGADETSIQTPPVFMVFDCLHERGRDLRPLPLDERRAVLEDEIMGRDLIYPARRLPDHGLEAWTMVKQQGWEGLVAKDPATPYSEGSTWRWLKVKVRHEGQFIVGGVMRSGRQVTGPLVGQRERGRLLYRGTVEWGLFRQLVTELVASVEGLVQPTSPFADLRRATDVTWLAPRLLAEVSYSELMEDRLRDPVLRELRVAR